MQQLQKATSSRHCLAFTSCPVSKHPQRTTCSPSTAPTLVLSRACATSLVVCAYSSPGSDYLDHTVLNRCAHAFNISSERRMILIANTVDNLQTRSSSTIKPAFVSTFTLLADQGISAIRMIEEATTTFPSIMTVYPELT